MTEIPFETMATIDLELLRKFSEASGDPNPIHLDEKTARERGLPGVIAHGMLIASLATERAIRWVGPEAKLVEFEVRFRAMTLLGQTIRVGGMETRQESNKIHLELTAQDEKDEVKTQIRLTFISSKTLDK